MSKEDPILDEMLRGIANTPDEWIEQAQDLEETIDLLMDANQFIEDHGLLEEWEKYKWEQFEKRKYTGINLFLKRRKEKVIVEVGEMGEAKKITDQNENKLELKKDPFNNELVKNMKNPIRFEIEEYKMSYEEWEEKIPCNTCSLPKLDGKQCYEDYPNPEPFI